MQAAMHIAENTLLFTVDLYTVALALHSDLTCLVCGHVCTVGIQVTDSSDGDDVDAEVVTVHAITRHT